MKKHHWICSGLLLSTALTGCGKGLREVTLSSTSFNTTGVAALFHGYQVASLENVAPGAETSFSTFSVTPASAVSEFKFCIKRIRLIGEDGESVKKPGETGENGEKDPDDIRFEPGLVDVGAGTSVDWGKASIPVGFKLSRLRIKVKKDTALCGTDYSVKFNDATTPQDLEFKWKFDPPIELDESTEKLSLSLADVVSRLRQAADDGTLASLKDHIEGVEASGGTKQ